MLRLSRGQRFFNLQVGVSLGNRQQFSLQSSVLLNVLHLDPLIIIFIHLSNITQHNIMAVSIYTQYNFINNQLFNFTMALTTGSDLLKWTKPVPFRRLILALVFPDRIPLKTRFLAFNEDFIEAVLWALNVTHWVVGEVVLHKDPSVAVVVHRDPSTMVVVREDPSTVAVVHRVPSVVCTLLRTFPVVVVAS